MLFGYMPKYKNPFVTLLLPRYSGDDNEVPRDLNPNIDVYMVPVLHEHIPIPIPVGPQEFTPE